MNLSRFFFWLWFIPVYALAIAIAPLYELLTQARTR